MTFEEYQKKAVSFMADTANDEEYLTLSLIAKFGEVATKLMKRRYDGVFDKKIFIEKLGDILCFVAVLADYYDRTEETNYSFILKDCFEQTVDNILPSEEAMKNLLSEVSNLVEGYDIDNVGNIAYYITNLACGYSYTLEQVAEINLTKLLDRATRGVIQGNGDER